MTDPVSNVELIPYHAENTARGGKRQPESAIDHGGLENVKPIERNVKLKNQTANVNDDMVLILFMRLRDLYPH